MRIFSASLCVYFMNCTDAIRIESVADRGFPLHTSPTISILFPER